MASLTYTYDAHSRRYRTSTGRFLSAQQVRAAVDDLIHASAQTMRQDAQEMMDGKINFAEWQVRSLSAIKHLHLATALSGNGGRNMTTTSYYSAIGDLLKAQYRYFRGMVKDIKTGKQALNGTLLSRVQLYAEAARGSHEHMRKRSAIAAGLQYERNILGLADHCHGAANGCIEQTQRGWVNMGELVPVGSRLCGPNCKCTTEQK